MRAPYPAYRSRRLCGRLRDEQRPAAPRRAYLPPTPLS